MDRTTVERQQILEAVSTLAEEALVELARFLNYLRYKSTQRRKVNNACFTCSRWQSLEYVA